MLEIILDPSRTHKCRGKQNPIYERKQGLRTKAQNHISNLKGGGKKSVLVLEEASLEMLSFPYDQVGKL